MDAFLYPKHCEDEDSSRMARILGSGFGGLSSDNCSVTNQWGDLVQISFLVWASWLLMSLQSKPVVAPLGGDCVSGHSVYQLQQWTAGAGAALGLQFFTFCIFLTQLVSV